MHAFNAQGSLSPNSKQQAAFWCLITGAGSGLGRALAIELAARGHSLLLTDLSREGLEETSALCLKSGAPSIETRIADVRDPDHWQELLSFFEGSGAPVSGRRSLHLLVNNAGVASAGLFEQIPLETWQWTLDINLMGVIRGCHAFLPLLRRQGRGSILNIASAAGLASLQKMAAYNASKAGVVALSETLAAELHGTDITVTVACPTFFQTNIMKNGRTMDERTGRLGQANIERGPQASTIARRTLKAVDRAQLYALPMWDAQIAWRLKRLSPPLFQRTLNAIARWIESRS
jgi:short-subunit dehydrogenase